MTCKICGTQKQVKPRACPYRICPDEQLCRVCYYSGTEDHSTCYLLQTDTVLIKKRKRESLIDSGEYVFSSSINVGNGIIHAIFHGKVFDIGRYVPIDIFMGLPKNEIITLSQIDSLAKLESAPTEFQIEFNE
jgi:hypothetical protein